MKAAADELEPAGLLRSVRREDGQMARVLTDEGARLALAMSMLDEDDAIAMFDALVGGTDES